MYFGSVRFFRHLILAVLVLLIAIPTFLAIRFFTKYHETDDKLSEVEAIVSEYAKKNDNALADNLAHVLNNSLDDRIPVFQQQVDATVGEQVGSMKTEIDSAIDSRLDELEKSLQDSTAASVSQAKQQLEKNLNNQMAALREDLTEMVGKNNTELQTKINQRMDETSAGILQQWNETLTDQVALLMQKIDEVKSALGSK